MTDQERSDGRTLLLEVRDLRTYFHTESGVTKAVDGVDLSVYRGETLCVVGESGCGKSVTAQSILQLVGPPGAIEGGQILYHRPGEATPMDLASMDPKGRQIRDVRGGDIAMIFQDPLTSLSPLHTVGKQMSEAVLMHMEVSKSEARERCIEALGDVGIPRPELRIDAYPFELSGGMRQRAMIATALACEPALLIADEPTTALDVTTQAQILDLLATLQEERGMAIMFITHDLGVVAELADHVAVLYLGQVAEQADVDSIFYDPKHPYTQALLHSIPQLGMTGQRRLNSIRGGVPDPYNRPAACPFHPRCDQYMPGQCDVRRPQATRIDGRREVRCLLYGDDGALALEGKDAQ